MRVAWSFLCALLLVVFVGRADALDGVAGRAAVFDEAVDAYRVGDLESAEALFEQLLDEELTAKDRGIVLFDLGNIAYRGERFLEAVAYYTAATEHLRRDADLWHNLELARSRAGLAPADAGDLAATVTHVLALPTDTELLFAGWLVVGLLGLALGAEVVLGGRTPKIVAGVLVLALVGDLLLLEGRAAGAREAPAMVIVEGGAELYSEPRAGRETGVRLEPADEVEVLDQLGAEGQPGSWVKVSAEAGDGWVHGAEVLLL